MNTILTELFWLPSSARGITKLNWMVSSQENAGEVYE